MPPGSNFSLLSLGGAKDAIVEVKLCSADMKRSIPPLTASSAPTAHRCNKRRPRLISLESLSVGDGRRGVVVEGSSCGLSVMPDAGSGVVDAISRMEGMEGAS